MKKVTYLLSMLIVVALFTASCKKGDVGPQGDKGDTGAAGVKGATGAAGEDGVKGATGTANVIYSDWLPAKSIRDTLVDGTNFKIADLPATKLTQAIIDGGSIMVYFSIGGTVFPLPYTSSAGGKANTISFWPRLGRFIINRYSADNSGSINLSTLLLYRYVLIPGGVKTAVTKKINLNDYQAVVKYYGIKN
ncbi:Collagen triple helix repeat-containing protein [Mucilaginibacter pineti]|uniref:Collagen triple helix repeat-containing protein n=1 Tax=Mucilaginibacter pineti TaxID=1391627 RepID=A0A1G6YN76_9SPHI|nr:collagen-like protein [Mucilaginibacter pineti]SDD91761.1 Collagen triple helix repeat-containing protein [Mucilaginibacter pineti]